MFRAEELLRVLGASFAALAIKMFSLRIAPSREQRRHPAAISDVLRSESLFQLPVFHTNHQGSREDCEGDESEVDDQASSDTPCKHFAQMAEIDRMAGPGADAAGDEPLIAVIGLHFWNTSELGRREAVPRA